MFAVSPKFGPAPTKDPKTPTILVPDSDPTDLRRASRNKRKTVEEGGDSRRLSRRARIAHSADDVDSALANLRAAIDTMVYTALQTHRGC